MSDKRLEPPAYFDDEHRAIWADAVTRLTSSGRVFRADPEVLAAYVEAVRSHRQATRLLAQSSVMIVRDGKAVENPALAIQQRAAAAMAAASRSLGLDRVPGTVTAAEPEPVHDSKFCGGPKRQGEGNCTRPAGWGTPHPGTGRCKLHGGCLPTQVTAALNERAARELARLDVPPVTNPFDELARLAGQCVAWKDDMGAKVSELTGLRYEGGVGTEQLRAEVALWERALDRCLVALSAMAKLNIEARLAGVRQATAQMLEEALTAALAKSGLDITGQSQAREAFRQRLRVVS
jgi:P27 family predicted phage terminase small subunit